MEVISHKDERARLGRNIWQGEFFKSKAVVQHSIFLLRVQPVEEFGILFGHGDPGIEGRGIRQLKAQRRDQLCKLQHPGLGERLKEAQVHEDPEAGGLHICEDLM